MLSVGVHLTPLGLQDIGLLLLPPRPIDGQLLEAQPSALHEQGLEGSKRNSNAHQTEHPIASATSIASANALPDSRNQQVYYLEVPIMFSRVFSTRFVHFEPKIGASAAVLMANRFDIPSDQHRPNAPYDRPDPANLYAIAAVGVILPMANGFSLVVEPTLRLGLQPQHTQQVVGLPLSYAVRFGVGYSF